MRGSQKKWPSCSQDTVANSIAEGNQHTLLVRVESSCSLQTERSSGLSLGLQSLEGSSSPAVFVCSLALWTRIQYVFTFCSRQDHPVAAPLMTERRARVRASANQRACACTLSRATPGMCPCAPFSTCRRRSWVTGGGRGGNNLRCSLLPAPSASICSAQPRSVKPQILHSLGYETEEEGETEGGNDRETRSSAHSGTDKLWAFCLPIASAETHLPSPSQFSSRISTQRWKSHLCFISVFKFGSNICQTFFFSLLVFSSLSVFSFFFLCPRWSEVVWLVNPERPRTDSSLYYSTGETDRFADR